MPARGINTVRPTRSQVARVCRMYRTMRLASGALGVNSNTLYGLCVDYGIETPAQRNGTARRG